MTAQTARREAPPIPQRRYVRPRLPVWGSVVVVLAAAGWVLFLADSAPAGAAVTNPGNLFFEPDLAQALGTDIAGAYVGGFATLPADVTTPAIEEYLASADEAWESLPGALSGNGGGLASFEATRLATGYHNANRFEIHGERGALRFDFERMNELDRYNRDTDPAVQGWTTIDVTRGGDGHPYAEAWWPDSHGLGYEHTFINQAADILAVIGGGQPRVPLPDFADALQTQRVLHAAVESARNHCPVTVDVDGPSRAA